MIFFYCLSFFFYSTGRQFITSVLEQTANVSRSIIVLVPPRGNKRMDFTKPSDSKQNTSSITCINSINLICSIVRTLNVINNAMYHHPEAYFDFLYEMACEIEFVIRQCDRDVFYNKRFELIFKTTLQFCVDVAT